MTWYERNRERILAAAKADRARHPEKYRARSLTWQRNNPERAAALAKKYKTVHRHEWNAYMRDWRARKRAAQPQASGSEQQSLLPSPGVTRAL